MATIFSRLRQVQHAPGNAEEPDANLVRRALQDREAFAALYLRYVHELNRFCLVRLQDEDAARDATQQIFVQALAGLARYRETGQFRAWLYTIARHVLANQTRHQHATSTLDSVLEMVDPGLSPEEATTATLERHALLAAVRCLPEDQRTAVELRLGGLSGPEVAAVMGRSHEAIKKLQLRALERLRADLARSATTQEVRRGA